MNPVSGTIILVDVKAHVPFKTSPLPQDFNKLHLFVCGKIVSYKIIDFLIEIYVGKEFLAVMDDESYALHCSENVFTKMLVRKIHEQISKYG